MLIITNGRGPAPRRPRLDDEPRGSRPIAHRTDAVAAGTALRGRRCAKGALQGYLDAYYIWEAGLKLMTIAAMLEYHARRPAGQPIPEPLKLRLDRLERPALGHWLGLFRKLLEAVVGCGAPPEDRYREMNELMSTSLSAADWPRIAELQRVANRFLAGTSGTSGAGAIGAFTLADVFDRMVQVRNRMFHGEFGRHHESVYERFWFAMLPAFEELFSRVDVLFGSRLVYITKVGLVEGVAEFEWSELTGLREGTPKAADAPRSEAAHLDGGRVYLLARGEVGPKRFRAAHPYLYFQPQERAFWMLAEVPRQRSVVLLSYTTGKTETLNPVGIAVESSSISDARRVQFGEGLRALLSRIFGVAPDPALAPLAAQHEDGSGDRQTHRLIDDLNSWPSYIARPLASSTGRSSDRWTEKWS